MFKPIKLVKRAALVLGVAALAVAVSPAGQAFAVHRDMIRPGR